MTFSRRKTPEDVHNSSAGAQIEQHREDELVDTPHRKTTLKTLFPVMAAGSGLFSDGYLNNVIGSVSTLLSAIYKDAYTNSTAKRNVSSLTFVGTVLGQLIFGYLADKWSRKNALLLSTTILFVFAVLATGSYGAGGSAGGLFTALTAYRFLLGIGIGGEYPAGSVAAAEASGETKRGTRNTWFVMFTNVAIDWGFVIGAFVPYVVVLITGEETHQLSVAWRWMLGVGCIFPLAVFILRLFMNDPQEFKRESMSNVRIPYRLVIRFYWARLAAVMVVWFLYDFSAYAFGIYSSTIVAIVLPSTASYAQTFGWNTVINLFYIPGAMLGGPASDWIGAKYTLIIGVTLQAIVGYIMAGCISNLQSNIAAFCVVYGIFLSLGELGPGDNIGLLASKSCATGVRGQYYGIAAAFGKVGAFVGTYAFPSIQAAGGLAGSKEYLQYPFWVASTLAIVSAVITYFFIPNVGQDTITFEDVRFREYLESNGWDTAKMGVDRGVENVVESGERSHDVSPERVREKEKE